MAILLVADIINGSISLDQPSKTLTAANELGEVTVLCASMNCDDAANAVSRLEGVKKVLVADDEIFRRGLAEPLCDLIVKLAENFSHIIDK